MEAEIQMSGKAPTEAIPLPCEMDPGFHAGTTGFLRAFITVSTHAMINTMG